MSSTAWQHPLGLKKTEFDVIKQALGAWSLVENGNWLVSLGRTKSAERMIARGYLTEVNRLAPTGWLVVKITQENIDAYNSALTAAAEPHHDQ